MKQNAVGISDIFLYVPEARIGIDELVERRVSDDPRLERHLERACRVTGQRAIRFPAPSEDTPSMAATAAYGLIRNSAGFEPKSLRYLVVGTESGVDHSKPISAYVQGMLTDAGVPIPRSLSSFQVQHACAAGTLGMLNVAALLSAAGRDDETGIVVTSDVARYRTHSTAEVTQGAGAVALLLSSDPDLLELDLTTLGYCSRNEDDFFRPLGSTTAMVKGSYSMKVYKESMEEAFLDHCRREGKGPSEVLRAADIIALHTPFRNLAEIVMVDLLGKYLGLDDDEAAAFLAERGFYHGVDAVAEIGNIYTGSLFLTTAFTLGGLYREIGEQIEGKSVLFASYGSGSTMTVMSGRVAENASDVIARWDLDAVMRSAREADWPEYEAWTENEKDVASDADNLERRGNVPTFMLAAIREDGYRTYAYTDSAAEPNPAETLLTSAYSEREQGSRRLVEQYVEYAR